MLKKTNEKSVIVDQEIATNLNVVIEEKPMEQALVQTVETLDFDKAFRLYKKDNADAAKWTVEALKVFCRKRVSSMASSTLEEWFNIFKQY